MEQNDISNLLSGVMNDPEIISKLSGVLSDPSAMATVTNAVSAMASKNETPQAVKPPVPVQSEESKNRTRLISALKPYLNEDRRSKADKLMGLLTLLELSGSGNLFNGGK